MICNRGADKLVARTALERWILQVMRAAGWTSTAEQHVVDWNRKSKRTGKVVRAVLVVVGTRPDRVTVYADVSVRSPMAARYTQADAQYGSAIYRAEC